MVPPLRGEALKFLGALNGDCSAEHVPALMDRFTDAICGTIASGRVSPDHLRATLRILENAAKNETQLPRYQRCCAKVDACLRARQAGTAFVDDSVEVVEPGGAQECFNEEPHPSAVVADSVVCIGHRGTDPFRNLPHVRTLCGNIGFGQGRDHEFCQLCYCLVCDCPAQECPDWLSHCSRTKERSAPRAEQRAAPRAEERAANRAGAAAERRRRQASEAAALRRATAAEVPPGRRELGGQPLPSAAAADPPHGAEQAHAGRAEPAASDACPTCPDCRGALDEMHAILGCQECAS